MPPSNEPPTPLGPRTLALADRARPYYDVDFIWIPRGDVRCYGRAFSFWRIEVGPRGWRERQAPGAIHREAPKAGQRLAPISVEFVGDMFKQLCWALNEAKRTWPECWQVAPKPDDPKTSVGSTSMTR